MKWDVWIWNTEEAPLSDGAYQAWVGQFDPEADAYFVFTSALEFSAQEGAKSLLACSISAALVLMQLI
jgi:hypothetical protein